MIDNEHIGLNIGCGYHPIESWYNVDIDSNLCAHYMDASKPFPFEDEHFRYVISEHMLEHLTIEQGLSMLNETYRVLVPEGVFRLSIPTKDKLDEIYNNEEKYNDYIDFHFENYESDYPIKNACILINDFYRMWGHKSIYDKKTIIELLKYVGFRNVIECQIGISSYKELNDVERHNFEIGDKFNLIETQVFEAIK